MKIPLPTRIMLESSRIVQDWWWLAAVITITAVAGFRFYTRTPDGKLWWDETRLKIPILGDALRKPLDSLRTLPYSETHGFALDFKR